jgi:hypothetical protein
MCVLVGKLLVLLGLGMTFTGLIAMIKSKKIVVGNKSWGAHTVTRPMLDKFAWGLTICGYLFQIVGVSAPRRCMEDEG